MNDRLARFTNLVIRHRRWRTLTRIEHYIRDLKTSDRAIVYILSVTLVVVSIVSLYTLEHSFLIQVPATGGTLVEGELGSPSYVNPLLALSDADRDITTLTYAGLTGLSSNGAIVPILAKSYTISSNGKIYTFTIRENARFSDGTPVTANDVVFTVKKAQDPSLRSPQFSNWNGVVVKALNTRVVQFTLPRPYAPFLENTTLGILPAHLWKDVSNTQFPFVSLELHPVGAGPFTVRNIVRSNGLITEYDLKASDDYVLGRPYIDELRIKFYPRQSALTNAIQQGDIESTYGTLAPSKGNIITAPFSSVFGVFFNPNDKPVLTNKIVREALSVAIDRESIIKDILNGYAQAIGGPIPPSTKIRQTTIPSNIDTIKNASAIFKNAGWTYDGNSREWKNAKKKLSFGSITIKTSNSIKLKAVASVIRKQWQRLGISVSIELYEPGDLNQNVIRTRKYEALLFGMVIGHEQDLYAFWHSSQQKDPGLNIALYANKTVDKLLEEVRATSSPLLRTSYLNDIERTISADYPAVFLYTPEFVYTIPSDIHSVVLPQIAVPSDRFASVTRWYKYTNLVWPIFVSRNK